MIADAIEVTDPIALSFEEEERQLAAVWAHMKMCAFFFSRGPARPIGGISIGRRSIIQNEVFRHRNHAEALDPYPASSSECVTKAGGCPVWATYPGRVSDSRG